jgi:hypothetical protein
MEMNRTAHGCVRVGVAALALAFGVATAEAASHREAPAMTLDPGADITDVYAFVSYDAANVARPPAERMVTLVMNVVPGQEPSSGPNYYAFDDDVLYEIWVDNDRDGIANDVRYEVKFETTIETPDQFLATLALPPLTALEGPDAAGAAVKQRYRVTEYRGCDRLQHRRRICRERIDLFAGELRPTVPSNIGPLTTPMYANLAGKGIFVDPPTGIRVFAGQRAETFAIDLGAVFDTINLRVENAAPIPGVRPPLPVQTAAEDANDLVNPFGINAFSGFNVNTIAIEVPVTRLTRDRGAPSADSGTIGVFASTSRRRITTRRGEPLLNQRRPPADLTTINGPWVQVSRMGNPLVNELIIRIGRKDLWNATLPEDEALFLPAYRNLAVGDALELVSGVPVPDAPREDIVQALLKYAGQNPDPNVGPFSELLRLDMTVEPTPVALISRLGVLAHDAAGNPTPDPAGFPNGRRPDDDVTDVVVRLAGGPNFIANFVGDGVGISESGITPEFPFLPTPFDGRNRRHRDPGES